VLNRRAFDERTEALFGNGGVQPVVVACWDIDHLKAVNDFHGHPVGNQVLRHVAERLSTVLGATGALALSVGTNLSHCCLRSALRALSLLLEAAARAVRLPIEGTESCCHGHLWGRSLEVGRALAGAVGKGRGGPLMAKRRGRGGIGFADRE
jgi:GGDEF domain-containing protein